MGDQQIMHRLDKTTGDSEQVNNSVSPPPPPPKILRLTAAVTVVNRTGTQVDTRSMAEAIRTIVGRHHETVPIIGLDKTHAADSRFSPGHWTPRTTTDGKRVLATVHDAKRADYKLVFSNFRVIDTSEDNPVPRQTTLDSVFLAAQHLADTSLTAVELEADGIPGFIDCIFDPQTVSDEDRDPAPTSTDEDDEQDQGSLEQALEDTEEGLISPPDHEPLPAQNDSAAEPKTALPVWKRTSTKAAAVTAAIVTAGSLALSASLLADQRNETPAGNQDWVSQLEEPTAADAALDADYTHQLWSIDPTEIDQLRWTGAGPMTITTEEIALLDHQTGDELASMDHQIEDFESDSISYASEFYADEDTPAVGARVDDDFLVLAADGETQRWEIPEDHSLTLYGETPMLTSNDGETHYALITGTEDPVEITTNPELHTRGIDGEHIVEVDVSSPRVVLNPTDPDNEEVETIDTNLTPATEQADFIRHRDAGHGLALASWEVNGAEYIGVHDLHADGKATAFFPAPASADEQAGWSLGQGLQLALFGPYAIDLDTGELVSQSATGDDLHQALGDAVIEGDGPDRTLTVDNELYTQQRSIYGWTGAGTVLVRDSNGDFAAYGESAGHV